MITNNLKRIAGVTEPTWIDPVELACVETHPL
jgi:hypothetical protein